MLAWTSLFPLAIIATMLSSTSRSCFDGRVASAKSDTDAITKLAVFHKLDVVLNDICII